MTKHFMRGPQHLHIFANICCFVNYSKAEAVRELMWREVLASLLEMDT